MKSFFDPCLITLVVDCLLKDHMCTSTEGAIEVFTAVNRYECVDKCKASSKVSQINYAYVPSRGNYWNPFQCYCLAKCDAKQRYFNNIQSINDNDVSQICKMA